MAAGGTVLLTEENNFLDEAANAAIAAVILGLGSILVFDPQTIDIGFNTATIATLNSFTVGTDRLQFAATSLVFGGTSLYNTTGGLPFMAFEVLTPSTVIPEPATWSLMIAGFGLV
jgi:hypothetical protein